jgi:hypothetical protein
MSFNGGHFKQWIIAFAPLQAEPGSALKGLVVPLGPLTVAW